MSRPWGGVSLADPWDEGEGVLKVANLLWDTNGLTWVKQTAAAGAAGSVSIADGADVCQGATTDAAVVGDVTGTLAAKIRGLSKILNDVWNSGTHQLNVATTGGGTILRNHLVSGGSTNATSIKGSAGVINAVRIFNNAAYPIYVKFHNTAGVPTAGNGVVETVGVQAGTQYFGAITGGDNFTTGIGMTIVKGIADADATAVLANDGVVDVFYT